MSAISKYWASEPQQATSSKQMRRFLLVSVLTLFAFTILMAYLSPFAYMASTSLKDLEMISNPDAPLFPAGQATFEYEGKDVTDKIVLVDKLPSPERAVTAVKHGAAAMVAMSEGHMRHKMIVTPVWGTPTLEEKETIPRRAHPGRGIGGLSEGVAQTGPT